MSLSLLDLKKQVFLYGNIDICNYNFKRINLETLKTFYTDLDITALKKDKSWPWRFRKNFKILLECCENTLLTNIEEFNRLLEFLKYSIDFYEKTLKIKSYNFDNPITDIDFFGLNVIFILDFYKNKLKLYKRSNSFITLDFFDSLFEKYNIEEKDFMFDYVSPYDEIKWTSKWKFLSKNKEITFDNIDIYLDSYFKNTNLYYNSSMCNNIKSLKDRLCFLREYAPKYLEILEKNLPKITEKFFNIFPYGILYKDYRDLLDFNVYLPNLLQGEDKKTVITDDKWFFSILPDYLSSYLLGFPVISLDIPGKKDITNLVEKLENLGEKKYFDYINKEYNLPYIKSISFGIKEGNLTEEGKILDLCYNDICDFNQDDVSCLFNNNVVHYFTSKEFRSILKKQENPYNRQLYPNINKIVENLKFKNKLKKSLSPRGLDVELDETMIENFQEIKKKISSNTIVHYFPHIENNTDIFYRPLIEILLNATTTNI
tara:strand:- start:337 stop:1797 length:1461 start_codon:yes stop_codon:yes gene_type:complete